MKYLSCAVVALIGLTAPAAAADMGGSSKDGGFDTPTAGVSVKSWSGFYLGAELGYGKANGDITNHSTHTTPAVPGQAGVPGKDAVAAIPGTTGVSRLGDVACTAGTPNCEGAVAEVVGHTLGDPCSTPGSHCVKDSDGFRYHWNNTVPHQDARAGTLKTGAVCNYGEAYCHGASPAVEARTKGALCYSTANPACQHGIWQDSVDGTPAVQGRTHAGDPCVAGREGCIGGSVAVAAVDAIPAVPAIAGVAASVLVQDDYSTISPAGLFGDITLGADFQGSGSNVVLGVFGNYSFGGIDANVGSGYDNITMSIDNQYQLGLRAGYLVTPTTLAYAKVGYSGGELNVTHTGAGEWKNPSLSGYTVAAGVETRLYGGLFGRAEYDYTAYGKNDFYAYSDATTTETSSVDLSVHAAKAGLVYKFGMGN